MERANFQRDRSMLDSINSTIAAARDVCAFVIRKISERDRREGKKSVAGTKSREANIRYRRVI